MLIRKEYGSAESIRDEGAPARFYAVRRWTDAAARRQSCATLKCSG